MLFEELRRPWALAFAAVLAAIAVLVLYDRLRTPPYGWSQNPDGVALTLNGLSNKWQLQFGITRHQVEFEAARPSHVAYSLAVEEDMPDTYIARKPHEAEQSRWVDPLHLDAENWAAIDLYRTYYQAEYELLAVMRDHLHLMRHLPHPNRSLWNYPDDYRYRTSSDAIQQVAYAWMLHYWRSGDVDAAVRALNDMALVSLYYAHEMNVFSLSARTTALGGAIDAAEVLINLEDLNLRQWAALLAGQQEPRETLVRDARLALEADGTRGIQNFAGIADQFFGRRHHWRDEYAYSVFAQYVPQELALHSAAALLGYDALDRAILVRAVVDQREHYHPMRESWFEGLEHRLPFARRYGADRAVRYYWGGMHPRTWIWPQVALAAAAVDLHRREHGAWPESLEAISPELIEALLQETGRQQAKQLLPGWAGDQTLVRHSELRSQRRLAAGDPSQQTLTKAQYFERTAHAMTTDLGRVESFFDDPHGSDALRYRPTTRGVVVYSVGPNEFDNALEHQPTRRRARQLGVDLPAPSDRHDDDIRIELLDLNRTFAGN